MQRSLPINKTRRDPAPSVDKLASDIRGTGDNSNVKRGPADVVAVVDVQCAGGEDGFDKIEVLGSDCSEESFSLLDINLLAPFAYVNGVEASRNALTTWVLLDEPGVGLVLTITKRREREKRT